MERKQRAATLSGAVLGVLAVGLVLVNMLAYSKNYRFDGTANERFTLSRGSANLVSKGLKEQMLITLYVSRGAPKTALFVEDLISLMTEYEEASAGKLKYIVKEPKTDEERKEAADAGLQEAAFGEGSETGADTATISRGYLGIVFAYGSEKEVIPILSPEQSQGLEFWVTNKIRAIRDKADDIYQTVGVIVRDGIKLDDANLTPPQGGRPGPSIKQILQQALPFYKIEDVDLEDGAAEVDESYKGVIVLQADKDWTDKELARIDQFLMKGDKSLLVIAGAVNMKAADPTMKADLSTRGLEKLLDGYGIEMKNEVIIDAGSEARIPFQTRVGSVEWVLVRGVSQIQHDDGAEENEQMLDNSFAGFFRLEELTFPYPSTLVKHEEKQPGAKFKVVVRSSEYAQVETSATLDLRPNTELKPTGEEAQRDIAISLEGPLKSAFADAPVEGVETPKESKLPSRVLVIASPQFLANPLARAGNPPPTPPQMAMMGAMGGDKSLQMVAMPYAQRYMTNTILAFKNLLDWMSGDSDLVAVSAKLVGDPNLSYSGVKKPKIKPDDSEEAAAKKWESYKAGRKSLQNWVQWTLTFLPSFLFALVGWALWRRREAGREHVRI